MHKTSWLTIGFAFCSRHQIRKHVGSIDGPMWNDGLAGYTELLLSTLHVLVPNFYGHWYCLPLDLFASVSFLCNSKLSDAFLIQNQFNWPWHSLVPLIQINYARQNVPQILRSKWEFYHASLLSKGCAHIHVLLQWDVLQRIVLAPFHNRANM